MTGSSNVSGNGTIRLARALEAWQTPAFDAVFKDEIERLDPALLPLQQGLSRSSHAVLDKPPGVIVLSTEDGPDRLRVRAGLAYTGIIAGCNCADDPTPVDEITEYCEAQFDIDRITAEVTITLLRD